MSAPTLSPVEQNQHQQRQQPQLLLQQPAASSANFHFTAFKYCAISSFIGALGGAAAKYNLQHSNIGQIAEDECIGLLFGLLVTALQLAATVGLNTFAMSFALRASWIAPASVTNTLCGGFAFVANALLGFILFGETVTPRFLVGLSIIFCGLYLICIDQLQQSEEVGPTSNPGFLPRSWAAICNLLWKIHLIFEPLEDDPIQTFLFGLLVGLAVVTTLLIWFMFISSSI